MFCGRCQSIGRREPCEGLRFTWLRFEVEGLRVAFWNLTLRMTLRASVPKDRNLALMLYYVD